MVLGAVSPGRFAAPELRIRWSVAIALAVPFAAITTLLVTLVIQARSNKVLTGAYGMLGEAAVAVTALNPTGKVTVRGNTGTPSRRPDRQSNRGARLQLLLSRAPT